MVNSEERIADLFFRGVVELSIKETITRTRFCPLLTALMKAPTNCLGRSCMFWSEAADKEYGFCEIVEMIKRVGRSK
jgi:hypothetical protein